VVLAFSHRQLLEAVEARYSEEKPACYRGLADYFWEQPMFTSQAADAPPDQRKASELTYHLYRAEQFERYRSLFDSQDWMQARFAASGRVYADYIDDLMTLWREIDQPRLLQAIDEKGQPAGLSGCLRYALIRTTVNSISGQYEPALIARAVAVSQWSPRRALDIITHISDPDRRFTAYKFLLRGKILDDFSREAAERAAFAAIQEMDNDLRVKELAKLLPLLHGDVQAHAVKEELELKAFEQLSKNFRYLSADLQQMVLTRILDCWEIRDYAYARVLPYINFSDLSADLQQMVLTKILERWESQDHDRVVPCLEGDKLSRWLKEAW